VFLQFIVLEGIVQMLRYENPSRVLEKIHAAVEELNNHVLPKGVKIHTFYDRTDLVDATLHTVSHTLLFGFLLVIGVLIIFLGSPKSKIEEQIRYDHSKFQIRWDGQFENQQRAYSRLALVVPLTLAVMFLFLFFTFGTFRQAGLLIGMLPLVIFGGMLALAARGMTFNVSSAVGFIALFGLSIQNGVLMLTHINVLRKRRHVETLRATSLQQETESLRKSVIEGAAHRLRPILMTSTVAVLGLLPASLATNIGSDVQRPLATVIVYGLMFSVIVTLYVLPVLYYLMEKQGKN